MARGVALQPRRTGAAGVLFLSAVATRRGQTLIPTPGFRQDIVGQVVLPADFSFERQVQIGTQANTGNHSPIHVGCKIRPWLRYDRIPDTKITFSIGYIHYCDVPGTSYYRHPEWRDTLMSTLQQPLHGGSLYDEIRGELLNFRDSHGSVQHLPRLRARFGQNLYVGEGGSIFRKPYLGLYADGIVQFPGASDSRVTFTSARFFAGTAALG